MINILEKYRDILYGLSKLIHETYLPRVFDTLQFSEQDRKLLQKGKEICELEINNYWNQKDSIEFLFLCDTYFDIATCFNYGLNNKEDIIETFKIIIFGYLGEHNSYVKNYLLTISEDINRDTTPEKWDTRILFKSLKALYFIMTRDKQASMENIFKAINSLREERKVYEAKFYNLNEKVIQPHISDTEIISLYYFIKLIELIGAYLVSEKQGDDIEKEINYYSKLSLDFAELSGDTSLFLLYKYFKRFCKKLTRGQT